MPVPADAAEAVIAAAADAVRRAADKERKRHRRGELADGRRRQKQEERDRKAAAQRGRRRAGDERLRAEAEASRAALLGRAAELAAASGGSVADCFAQVPDPRARRGRRHSLPSILALVVTAMLHGKTKLADITAWISHAAQEILAAAGARLDDSGRRIPPCGKTVTRLLGKLGAQALADAVAAYLAAAMPAQPPAYPAAAPVLQPSLNCDGKEIRGAARAGGTVPFLLSAAAGGIVLAEREIGAKTNEIPETGPMLRELNQRVPLAGWVITADALHTQARLAGLITRELGAHYVFTVKGNQKTLHAMLAGLNWDRARRHVTEDHGHGRDETRLHEVMTVPARIRVQFPHARQAARVTRTVTRTALARNGAGRTWTRTTQTSTETVYLITSMTPREAAPAHLAAYIRGHWSIENQVHWVRDVTLREDPSTVSAASRPRALATLRNLAAGLIRQHGRNDIAATIRDAEHDNTLLLALTRLTPPP